MNEIEKIVPALRQLEGASFEVRRPTPSEALSSLGPATIQPQSDSFGSVPESP